MHDIYLTSFICLRVYSLHVTKLHIVATGISAGVTSSAVKQVTTSPESQGSLEENKKMLQVNY